MAVHLNLAVIAALEKAIAPAALQAVDDLRGEIVSAQVMPFDMGDMQNNQTFTVLEKSDGKITARLVTGSPQARRLYFNPQYNFQQGKNSNAGGGWLLPWLNGDHKDFVQKAFAESYQKKVKP